MKRLLFTIFLVMGLGALSAQDSVNITFHVNMKAVGASPDGVFLGGGAGFGGPTDNQMTDVDGDGVYSITFRRPENWGSHYTHLNGNCPDWSCKENIAGQACADPGNFNDRRVDVTTNDTVIWTCFQECTNDTVCSPVAAAVNVTFRVDMTGQTFDSVFVTGGFAGWGGLANKMTDPDGDNIYEATTQIDPGAIEYKFVINGTDYEEWDSVGTLGACIMNFGGFINRFTTIPASDTVLCTADWLGCCAAAALYNVEFSVDVNTMSTAPTAVKLGANFDGWSGGLAMDDSDNDGVWTYTAMLPAGPIEYKFITNDGTADTWETLDSLNGQPCVMDFGGFVNRIDTVTGNVAFCTPIIGQCCAASGINDLLVNNKLFVLRPTLASDFAYLDFPELRGEQAQLQIINAMGQVVLREDIRTNGTHRLDVRTYATGLYFVQVKVGNTIGTQKMIVD
jgi:hypothetical protein